MLYAQSDEFRVDTDIFVGDNPKPAKQTITLFSQGAFYDFALDESSSITLIEPSKNRITLFDQLRQAKSVVDTQQLAKLVAEARQQATQGELAKLFDTAKQVQFDSVANRLSVGGKQLTYEATMQQPPSDQMASLYADFADWSARMNAVYPPHFPPYLRLELNKAVAQRGMLPLEIRRLVNHGGQSSVVRCRLHTNWRLSSEDHKKIARVAEMMDSFAEVNTSDFFSRADAALSSRSEPGKRR
jgi:hypothetical protein